MNEFDRMWRMMDKFMDGDMDFDALEREFDKQFARMEQDFYKDFFHTLKKTVELCGSLECCPPPDDLHASLCRAIECTPQVPPKRRKKPRKKR